MAKCKKYKVGDRIFYENYDGTVGTSIVLEIEPKSYVDDNGRTINYNMLVTERGSNWTVSTEDYNTLPYSDPRVKALIKELEKQDEFVDKIREFVNTNTDIYSIETIATALGQVAKEYGYKEE